MKLLLWGLFLKVVLADRLGLYVDSIYDNYTYQTGFSLFVASLCYSLQIYGDFAGYSLMAIGVAKVLGFDLINNFNRPYFATSITDFWHRWHISLSIWLRDYVYIPLGGSRCSKLRTYWNIFATFLKYFNRIYIVRSLARRELDIHHMGNYSRSRANSRKGIASSEV